MAYVLLGTLLAELREYNLEQQRRAQADSHSPDAPPEDSSISARLKGKMTSRWVFGIFEYMFTLSSDSGNRMLNHHVNSCGGKGAFGVFLNFGSRFDGSESVVIVAAQKRTLGGRELQLPCMSSLTSKTSTQKFFLRVLQVIIQLREDTRRANKKAKQTGRLGIKTWHYVP